MDVGQPVAAADSYTLDGQLQSFNNGVELSNLLASAKDTHACYVQNMMSYLNGTAPDGCRASNNCGLLRPGIAGRNDLSP